MHRGCPFKRFVRPERIDTNSIKTTARNGITMHHMVLHTNHGCSHEENTACTGLPQERWGMRIHGFVLDVQFGSWLSILQKKSSLQFERFESIWGILGFSVWWKMKVGKVGQVQGLQAPRPKQAQRSQSQTWPTKCQECCRTTKVSLSPVFVDFPDKSWQVY